jgi:hypothetical protein
VNEPMPKWAARWSKDREVGQRKFVVQTGLIRFGLTMFIITTFLNPAGTGSLKRILIGAFAWTVAGLFFGFALWSIEEHRYQRYLHKQTKRVPE